MSKDFDFLGPIPDGYQIYRKHLEVAGIHYRKNAAMLFLHGTNQRLDWEREPTNPHDSNAIKLFGVSKQILSTKRHMLGYVPQDTAEEISRSGFWPLLQPRLTEAWVGDSGFCVIRFQILGPKGRKHDYEIATELTESEENRNDWIDETLENVNDYLEDSDRQKFSKSFFKEVVRSLEADGFTLDEIEDNEEMIIQRALTVHQSPPKQPSLPSTIQGNRLFSSQSTKGRTGQSITRRLISIIEAVAVFFWKTCLFLGGLSLSFLGGSKLAELWRNDQLLNLEFLWLPVTLIITGIIMVFSIRAWRPHRQ